MTQPVIKPKPSLTTGQAYALLLLIFLLALALRFWQIDFGLPDFYHADENGKLKILTRVVNGENPNYFRHPGLFVNLLGGWNHLMAWCGGALDKPALTIQSRWFVALLGALTIWPVFWLGGMVFNRRTGLWAALGLAVLPDHVVHSRYHKEDILLVFLVCFALLGLVGWIKNQPPREGGDAPARSGLKWAALAIVAAALAAGTKYVGWVMVFFNCACWFVYCKDRGRGRAIVVTLVVSLLIVMACSPQVFTNFSKFSRDVEMEYKSGVSGDNAPSLNIYQWPDLGTHYFWRGLMPGMGSLFALLGLGGIVVAWRGRRRLPREIWWFVLAFVLWYVLAELTPRKRVADAERYILPAMALLTLAAAGLINYLRPARFLRWPCSPRLWDVLGIVVLVWAFTRCILLGVSIDEDTRQWAARWLMAEGPERPYLMLCAHESDRRGVASILDEIKFGEFELSLDNDRERREFEQARALWLTSLGIDRYEKYRLRSKRHLRRLAKRRADFPHAIYFSRPWWSRAGFHNPDIEIRFREPYPGTKPETIDIPPDKD